MVGVEIVKQRFVEVVVRRRRRLPPVELKAAVACGTGARNEVAAGSTALRDVGGRVSGIEKRIKLVAELAAFARLAEVEPVERLPIISADEDHLRVRRIRACKRISCADRREEVEEDDCELDAMQGSRGPRQ